MDNSVVKCVVAKEGYEVPVQMPIISLKESKMLSCSGEDCKDVSPGSNKSTLSFKAQDYDSPITSCYSDAVMAGNVSNMKPVVRQDSIALDIGLANPALETSQKVNNINASNFSGDGQLLLPNRIKYKINMNQSGRQENSSGPCQEYHPGVHQRQCGKEKAPSKLSECYSFPTKQPADFPESPSPKCNELAHRPMNSERVAVQKKPVETSEYNCNYCCTLLKENTPCQKSTFPSEENADTDKGFAGSRRQIAAGRPDGVTTIIMCAIVVLFIGIGYLHMRIAAIENGKYSSQDKCQCLQDQETTTKDQVTGPEKGKFLQEDINMKIIQYLDSNGNVEPSGGISDSDNILSHQEALFPRKDHMEISFYRNIQQHEKKHDSDLERLRSTESVSNELKANSWQTPFKVPSKGTEKIETISYPSNSTHSDSGSASPDRLTSETDVDGQTSDDSNSGIHLASDDLHFDLQYLDLDRAGQILSRKSRSPGKERDPAFTEHQRRRHDKGDNKNKKTQEKGPAAPKLKSHHSNTETFDVDLYSIFDYTKHFGNSRVRGNQKADNLAGKATQGGAAGKDNTETIKESDNPDCAPHENWEDGIQGCKDGTVNFTNKYSVLPFYKETDATANKKKRRIRLVGGRFHVDIPGDYLVQLNITIVKEEARQSYLAVFLNDRAMFACYNDSFACPHTNGHGVNKYRICNILGVLGLLTGDIVDVRTMEASMSVRVENLQKSYLRFIPFGK